MASYRDDWRLTGFFKGIGAIALAGGCAINSGSFALAQNWAYSSNGQVVLVAQAPTVTPQRPWQTSPSCDDFQTTAH